MLPREAEYYRPTRARQLEEQVYQLKGKITFAKGAEVAYISFAGIAVAVICWAIFKLPDELLLLFSGGTVLFCLFLASMIGGWQEDSRKRIDALEKEIRSLKSEHQARYSALSSGGEE